MICVCVCVRFLFKSSSSSWQRRWWWWWQIHSFRHFWYVWDNHSHENGGMNQDRHGEWMNNNNNNSLCSLLGACVCVCARVMLPKRLDRTSWQNQHSSCGNILIVDSDVMMMMMIGLIFDRMDCGSNDDNDVAMMTTIRLRPLALQGCTSLGFLECNRTQWVSSNNLFSDFHFPVRSQ